MRIKEAIYAYETCGDYADIIEPMLYEQKLCEEDFKDIPEDEEDGYRKRD